MKPKVWRSENGRWWASIGQRDIIASDEWRTTFDGIIAYQHITHTAARLIAVHVKK